MGEFDGLGPDSTQGGGTAPLARKRIGLLRRIASDALTGMGGGLPFSQAEALGAPQAAGMMPDDVRLFLQQPQREEMIQTAPVRRRLLEAQAAAAEALGALRTRTPQLGSGGQGGMSAAARLSHLERLTTGVNGMSLQAIDPDAFSGMFQEMNSLRQTLGRPPIGGGQSGAPAPAGGPQAPGGRIRVKLKSTGATGSVLPNDFDAKTMDKI